MRLLYPWLGNTFHILSYHQVRGFHHSSSEATLEIHKISFKCELEVVGNFNFSHSKVKSPKEWSPSGCQQLL